MGIIKRINIFLGVSLTIFLLSIISVRALDINKQYKINCCKEMDEITLYEATGKLDLNEKNMGLVLKSVERNGKYYMILSGTPTISNGNINFTGMTKDNDNVEVNYKIVITVGRETKNVTKTYDVIAGNDFGNTLVYKVDENLNNVNMTKNNVTLKTANINGTYGLYLVGTPKEAGTIHFSGTTYNSKNTYDVAYDVTVNVKAKERETIEVTKSYNGTVGKSIGDILIYQANGKISNLNSTKNGLTIKTDNNELRLSGTPTQGGVITFKGNFPEGDSYNVVFNITINVPNPNKPQLKVERLYNAVVDKEIGKVLIYEHDKTLPDLEKEEKGITLKTETVDGKTKFYLSGKPTEEGKVIFSGTLDEGNRDIVYYIIINISANKKTSNNNNNNSNNNGTNNSTTNNNSNNSNNNDNTITDSTSNNDNDNKVVDPNGEPTNNENNNKEPINDTKDLEIVDNDERKTGYNHLIIPAIIGACTLIGILVVINLISKKKKA